MQLGLTICRLMLLLFLSFTTGFYANATPPLNHVEIRLVWQAKDPPLDVNVTGADVDRDVSRQRYVITLPKPPIGITQYRASITFPDGQSSPFVFEVHSQTRNRSFVIARDKPISCSRNNLRKYISHNQPTANAEIKSALTIGYMLNRKGSKNTCTTQYVHAVEGLYNRYCGMSLKADILGIPEFVTDTYSDFRTASARVERNINQCARGKRQKRLITLNNSARTHAPLDPFAAYKDTAIIAAAYSEREKRFEINNDDVFRGQLSEAVILRQNEELRERAIRQVGEEAIIRFDDMVDSSAIYDPAIADADIEGPAGNDGWGTTIE